MNATILAYFRLTVEGERPSSVAIALMDSCRASPLEMASRSANDSEHGLRVLMYGRIPPYALRILIAEV